jgi:pimeloyl-ACP methyl ester carboxylesterase
MPPKPPLLLLHGVTMSAAVWAEVTPRLADRFDLIVPTAAGHRLPDQHAQAISGCFRARRTTIDVTSTP